MPARKPSVKIKVASTIRALPSLCPIEIVHGSRSARPVSHGANIAVWGAAVYCAWGVRDLPLVGDAKRSLRLETADRSPPVEIAGQGLERVEWRDQDQPHPPSAAPSLRARMALAESAPKLMAEMLKTDIE